MYKRDAYFACTAIEKAITIYSIVVTLRAVSSFYSQFVLFLRYVIVILSLICISVMRV